MAAGSGHAKRHLGHAYVCAGHAGRGGRSSSQHQCHADDHQSVYSGPGVWAVDLRPAIGRVRTAAPAYCRPGDLRVGRGGRSAIAKRIHAGAGASVPGFGRLCRAGAGTRHCARYGARGYGRQRPGVAQFDHDGRARDGTIIGIVSGPAVWLAIGFLCAGSVGPHYPDSHLAADARDQCFNRQGQPGSAGIGL